MKKILYLMIGTALMCLASCMEIDNWDAPDARFYGRVIDSYTGENLLSSQNDWSIRIWERTWTEGEPNYQSLSVKQDGSYNNTKLFAGTYDMLPYGGPFWPCDTAKNVVLKKSYEQDFTVTPYLQILDFNATLNGTELTLTCRLKAPRRDGLPDLYEIKPFLSLTTFCGNSNYINIGEYNDKRIQVNKSWQAEVGDSDTSKLYTIGPLPVKSGYTYYVRVGAAVNDANRKHNYSNIVVVTVP
ncbi:MAG: DUF3823 domain-containing protein [Tannerellaceae bacterium]|jgi:hypothetical protein|nr:DUF3823 domain-containing protein [Tannerellaceae bacterium]